MIPKALLTKFQTSLRRKLFFIFWINFTFSSCRFVLFADIYFALTCSYHKGKQKVNIGRERPEKVYIESGQSHLITVSTVYYSSSCFLVCLGLKVSAYTCRGKRHFGLEEFIAHHIKGFFKREKNAPRGSKFSPLMEAPILEGIRLKWN